jgi:hypothetical protein
MRIPDSRRPTDKKTDGRVEKKSVSKWGSFITTASVTMVRSGNHTSALLIILLDLE